MVAKELVSGAQMPIKRAFFLYGAREKQRVFDPAVCGCGVCAIKDGGLYARLLWLSID